MLKYQNKYRTETTRLKLWDYTNPRWYFVTICTKNHKEYFGEIKNEKMTLNGLGKIAEECWKQIHVHYKTVELDEFVIIPNHVHGIIILNNVETPYMASLQESKPVSLGDVIGKYKAAVTRNIRILGSGDFKWLPRFYDRIIRNEKELFNIRKYIKQNPFKWELEKDFPENIE